VDRSSNTNEVQTTDIFSSNWITQTKKFSTFYEKFTSKPSSKPS